MPGESIFVAWFLFVFQLAQGVVGQAAEYREVFIFLLFNIQAVGPPLDIQLCAFSGGANGSLDPQKISWRS